jgi:hypothetical protein
LLARNRRAVRPDSSKIIISPSRYKMKMQMHDCLRCGAAVRVNQVYAIGLQSSSYAIGDRSDPFNQRTSCFVIHRPNVLYMTFWDYQSVTRHGRSRRKESYELGCLKDNSRGRTMCGDLAEVAITHEYIIPWCCKTTAVGAGDRTTGSKDAINKEMGI